MHVGRGHACWSAVLLSFSLCLTVMGCGSDDNAGGNGGADAGSDVASLDWIEKAIGPPAGVLWATTNRPSAIQGRRSVTPVAPAKTTARRTPARATRLVQSIHATRAARSTSPPSAMQRPRPRPDRGRTGPTPPTPRPT